MKIPHLSPVRFAQKILKLEENIAKVKCEFPQTPTLAMFFEAAAQSSAAFSQEKSNIGFVVSFKDIELLKETDALEVIVQIEKRVAISNICEFKFSVYSVDENSIYATGRFTIMIQK